MALKPVTNPDVEVEPVELTIDGEKVMAKPGISLYDVISKKGTKVPWRGRTAGATATGWGATTATPS